MKRPQFGLRLLLLAITLIATVFGWIRARWEVNKLESIRRLEAELYWEEQSLAVYETHPPPAEFFTPAYGHNVHKAIEVTKADLKLLKK